MKSLKGAIQSSIKQKRTIKAAGATPKSFSVSLEFSVAEIKMMVMMVPASTHAEAERLASKAFRNMDGLHLAQRGSTMRPIKYTISPAKITDVTPMKAQSANLSKNQRAALTRMKYENLKLYREDYHGWCLKTHEKESVQSIWTRNVNQLTIDALYRKGLIIPEARLLPDEEQSVQDALGTMPDDQVLVLNILRVAEFKLRLKDPSQKKKAKARNGQI